jgi:hypothetical protein
LATVAASPERAAASPGDAPAANYT